MVFIPKMGKMRKSNSNSCDNSFSGLHLELSCLSSCKTIAATYVHPTCDNSKFYDNTYPKEDFLIVVANPRLHASQKHKKHNTINTFTLKNKLHTHTHIHTILQLK